MYNNTNRKMLHKKENNEKKGLVYKMKRRRRKNISENALRFLHDLFWVRSEVDVTLDMLVGAIDICKMLIKHNENEDYVDDLIDVLEKLEELLEVRLGENN